MLNQNMFKKVSMTLGLICVASLANDAPAFAAPRHPTKPATRPVATATASRTVKIPKRDAGYGGGTMDGDKGVPVPSGDSVPYHLTGSVVYEPTGYTPAPHSLGVALKEIHIVGWLDSSGHLPYPCGKFTINARHVSINGQDYSGRLVFEGGIYPAGWQVSSWVLRFPGPTYPTYPTSPGSSHGVTVAIRANVAYSEPCIPVGNSSLTTSVVIR